MEFLMIDVRAERHVITMMAGAGLMMGTMAGGVIGYQRAAEWIQNDKDLKAPSASIIHRNIHETTHGIALDILRTATYSLGGGFFGGLAGMGAGAGFTFGFIGAIKISDAFVSALIYSISE
jgi:hypothetical protein